MVALLGGVAATTGPDPAMLAALGASAPASTPDAAVVIPVLAVNWLTVQCWLSLQTQWRVGMAGPTGLAYEAVPVVLELMGVPKRKRPDIFAGLREMEDEALTLWSKRREH